MVNAGAGALSINRVGEEQLDLRPAVQRDQARQPRRHWTTSDTAVSMRKKTGARHLSWCTSGGSTRTPLLPAPDGLPAKTFIKCSSAAPVLAIASYRQPLAASAYGSSERARGHIRREHELFSDGTVPINMTAPAVWTRRGQRLEGPNSSDFGSQVAIASSGRVLMVGASRANTDAGAATVYTLTGDLWTPRGASFAGASGDLLGESVAMSANGLVVAVGSPQALSDDRGQVHVYEWNASTGVHELRGAAIEGSTANETFGRSIALSGDGNLLAIGAPWYRPLSGGDPRGEVRLYQWANSTWTLSGKVINDGTVLFNGTPSNNLGLRVALSEDGSTLAARYQHFVHVYRAPLNNNWASVGDAPDSDFGNLSLSADGAVLATGEPSHGADDNGRARVYDVGAQGFVQRGSDLSSLVVDTHKGRAVALSADGNLLAVAGSGLRGAVWLYAWNSTAVGGAAWVAASTGPILGPEDSSGFGLSMALASSSSVETVGGVQHITATVAVGARNASQAFVYRHSPTTSDSVPCFHGTMRVPLQQGWALARDVAVGTVVRTADGGLHPVTHVTQDRSDACVRFLAGALGPNVPTRPVIVTAIHLLRLPTGRLLRADRALALARPGLAHRCRPGLTVHHVGLADWRFVDVHGLALETLAWTPAHQEARKRGWRESQRQRASRSARRATRVSTLT